ncbi:aspartyl-phosphate phosphatase Spo0E family protein [Sulfoacidibacillus thermotolerans]|uniref:aspartyl-phosphate phosphatase Spo0E family protein n=1 Tax=Sulfoacidibacillus thermotolerans TaxID=1765684 RepID=UPI0015E80A53|nr:aspartyl-phosphate phosphatase Spo0E family protein [Sulfoacidibacillus thermotolerans]
MQRKRTVHQVLLRRIEFLRKELTRAVHATESFSAHEVLRISHRLDHYIILYQKIEMRKKHSATR